MIKDKSIFIRNIYYMLSYAFQDLRKNNYEDIAKEDFEQIMDLFAEILFKGVSMQLKQGLYKEYVERHESLSVLRGHLDINSTLRNKTQRKNQLVCDYDELSEDNLFNQIIKSCIGLLIRNENVKQKRKANLRSILPFFVSIRECDLYSVRWDMLTYQRNNQSYRMLINVCYFISEGTLMTSDKGVYRMATFSDEHMHKLYERFVLEYYRVHHSYLKACGETIEWNIAGSEDRIVEFLPSMKTDITLRNREKILIIDTKYYGRMTQQQFNKATIHSGNLYQIFTYVKNMDKENTGNVSGMLLYAKTNEKIVPDLDEYIGNNRFMVKTLDLSQEFSKISSTLDEIAKDAL